MTRSFVWHVFHPAPTIIPFFLPFAGCPFHCLYCAQDLVTGEASSPSLSCRFASLRAALDLRKQRGQTPPHLAFYGGTFTALPEADFAFCLYAGQDLLERGLISGLRCSTRPDALCAERLERLQASGFTLIELGIQSFDEAALAKTCRGYGTDQAEEACRMVREAGFALGVQLLPGMPGVTPKIFLRDVRRALALSPSCLRFYPCLVLAGTGLARLWQQGRYRPWDLATTLATLAHGYLLAQDAAVSVIRMGLAPQGDLLQHLLAGPWHPALGARVMARALYLAVVRELGGARLMALHLPRALQGFCFGEKGEMRSFWQRLGLAPAAIRFGAYGQVEMDLAGKRF